MLEPFLGPQHRSAKLQKVVENPLADVTKNLKNILPLPSGRKNFSPASQ